MPCALATRSTSAAMGAGSRTGLTSSCATRRPETAPLSPSTWSAWKWVRTTASRVVTPSRRRQPSTSGGSGPASTSTARCGPLRTTTASPWPTSHTTTRHPAGGQVTVRVGTSAAAVRRTAPRRSTGWVAAVRTMARPVRTTTRPSAARSRAPGAPSGHGSVPPGTRANTAGELRDRRGRDDAGPRDELGAAWPHHRGERGGHPGDGRHRDERRREEVREDTDHADRPLEEDDERARSSAGPPGARRARARAGPGAAADERRWRRPTAG